ncbi:MAG: glutamate racemase [Paludibacteraceae bacterium]|nr:glutamate racemase [Paludibacteraceae bacterium]
MKDANRKFSIGVFDSGYGGLTILEKFREKLPEYNYVYLGDNARTPYGTRSFEVVYQYTLECVQKLADMGCDLIILACNTASAKALRSIQENDLPVLFPNKRVLGVIRPTVEQVGNYTLSEHIGILGTEGTIQSESYTIEVNKLFPHIIVVPQACPMWVPLIENNEHEGNGADYFVQKYLSELLAKDNLIDTIVLGCTHYPLLLNKIQQYLPSNIRILSQGEIVANSLQNYLFRHPEIESKLSKEGKCSFFTTESASKFTSSASIFLKKEVKAERILL